MEVLILVIILLIILAYTSFNFKVHFQINNKQISFSIHDKNVSESSE